jgi:hypothetical protein
VKEQIVKTRNLMLVFALVATIVVMFMNKPNEEVTKLSSPIPLVISDVSTVPTNEKIPKLLDSPANYWASFAARLNRADATTFTPEEEEAFNALHVLPLNWIYQKDCTDLSCVSL